MSQSGAIAMGRRWAIVLRGLAVQVSHITQGPPIKAGNGIVHQTHILQGALCQGDREARGKNQSGKHEITYHARRDEQTRSRYFLPWEGWASQAFVSGWGWGGAGRSRGCTWGVHVACPQGRKRCSELCVTIS